MLKKAEELERLLDHYPRWRGWEFRKEIPGSEHSEWVSAPHPDDPGRLHLLTVGEAFAQIMQFIRFEGKSRPPGTRPQPGRFRDDPASYWRLSLERELVQWMERYTGQPRYELVALAVEVATDHPEALDPDALGRRYRNSNPG